MEGCDCSRATSRAERSGALARRALPVHPQLGRHVQGRNAARSGSMEPSARVPADRPPTRVASRRRPHRSVRTARGRGGGPLDLLPAGARRQPVATQFFLAAARVRRVVCEPHRVHLLRRVASRDPRHRAVAAASSGSPGGDTIRACSRRRDPHISAVAIRYVDEGRYTERSSCVRDRCPESTPRSSSRAQPRTPDPTARRRGGRGHPALRTPGGHARSRRSPWRLCGRSRRLERR